uniref:Uncharacterized protein n=1 Tax=Arundo donax TaxID=35708 RepID=A0A0A9HC66_ARUDO
MQLHIFDLNKFGLVCFSFCAIPVSILKSIGHLSHCISYPLNTIT